MNATRSPDDEEYISQEDVELGDGASACGSSADPHNLK